MIKHPIFLKYLRESKIGVYGLKHTLDYRYQDIYGNEIEKTEPLIFDVYILKGEKSLDPYVPDDPDEVQIDKVYYLNGKEVDDSEELDAILDAAYDDADFFDKVMKEANKRGAEE